MARDCTLWLEIGDYTLTADPRNYIITPTGGHKKKKDGTLQRTGADSRYFSTIPDALVYIVRNGLRNSDAKTVKELKEDSDKLFKWVYDQFNEAVRT